jgi:hypothetical protein
MYLERIWTFLKPKQHPWFKSTNRWGTTNGKPLGLIIMMGQSETLSSSSSYYIIFITLFSAGRCVELLCLLPATGIMLSQNHFPWAKPTNVRFSSSNYTLQDHLLQSTIGDALSGYRITYYRAPLEML